jgi:hypothetical protein
MSLVGLSGVSNDNTNENNSMGSTLTDIFDSVLKAAPGIITATKPQPDYGGGSYQYQPTQQTASTGISTNTILLFAVAGLGIYFLTKKK